jgi:tRNA A-37 threonylcarbamoyl transferase component Bud32
MEDLEADCLANVYGENPDDIPMWIWDEIRMMVKTLLDEEGIEYLDITPYNFIEKDKRIYMIDFGDAKYVDGETNWFLQEFIDGENYWNPDYK